MTFGDLDDYPGCGFLLFSFVGCGFFGLSKLIEKFHSTEQPLNTINLLSEHLTSIFILQLHTFFKSITYILRINAKQDLNHFLMPNQEESCEFYPNPKRQ